MKRMARHVCPECGSVSNDQTHKGFVCLLCGHRAKKFPASTDPVPSTEKWDGRERVAGQILPKEGAE